MKFIGNVILALIIACLARTGWSGEQNQAALSNQAAIGKLPVCIQVEVKFFELSQEALNQFDVEWNAGSKPDMTNGHSKVQQDNGTATNSAASHMSSLLTGSWTVFAASEAARIENILMRSTGCNLLSVPSVTTRSGVNAEIKVVREIIYPAKYNIQVVVADKKSGKVSLLSTNAPVSSANPEVFAIPIPEFTNRDTGVIFNVTPTAIADSKAIDLIINPKIVELVEWIDYGFRLRSEGRSAQQVKMLQPVFSSRNISANITVYDGQTAVMGGLIKENRVDDEPGEGKGSWFSRWFRSEPERKMTRTTLLVMVTARRVNLLVKN